jgi:hypothetical protein
MDIMPGRITYYALLDDCKIWAWRFSYSMLNDFIYTILCTCPGLILGVAVFITFMRYQGKNKAETITDGNE